MEKIKRYTPIGLTIISILIMAAGILMGEPGEVFTKAVTLCLSCIGLG